MRELMRFSDMVREITLHVDGETRELCMERDGRRDGIDIALEHADAFASIIEQAIGTTSDFNVRIDMGPDYGGLSIEANPIDYQITIGQTSLAAIGDGRWRCDTADLPRVVEALRATVRAARWIDPITTRGSLAEQLAAPRGA